MKHTFLLFFAWPDGAAWSNVVAMPACGVVAVVFAACFRKPAARWWHRHFGVKAELAEIRDLAARAHRIAADTHKRLTGEEHPDAPERLLLLRPGGAHVARARHRRSGS